MENLNKITVIAVKDKQDVIKAAELFEQVGIKLFCSENSKNKFIENGDDIKNNFLMKDADGGWRIQSHYIAEGTSIEELEKEINQTLLTTPNLKIYNKNLNNLKDDLDILKDNLENIKKNISTFEKHLNEFKM